MSHLEIIREETRSPELRRKWNIGLQVILAGGCALLFGIALTVGSITWIGLARFKFAGGTLSLGGLLLLLWGRWYLLKLSREAGLRIAKKVAPEAFDDDENA